MKIRAGLVNATVGVIVLAVAIAWQPPALGPGSVMGSPASDGPPAASDNRIPVLVELFTSEGCSSCPPADALLARLAKTQPVAAAEVVALEEHVDYWDRLGWRDPYSSAVFTARQNDYARVFGNGGAYTPQMVVDGHAEFIGGAEGPARQAIHRAAQSPKAAVQLGWVGNSAASAATPPVLRIQIGQVPPDDSAEAFLAVTEDNLHSDVTRGENAGRALDHFGVVRDLRRIGKLDAKAAASLTAEQVVKLLPAWKRRDLHVVVFAQEMRRRRVLAVASIPVPSN
jgi:hypothetical protein